MDERRRRNRRILSNGLTGHNGAQKGVSSVKMCICVGADSMSYKEGLAHLASVQHQEEVSKTFCSWPEEVDQRSVVIMDWPPQNVTILEASEFVQTFGFISDFMVHNSRRFTVVQLGSRNRIGRILGQEQTFNGSKLVIKPKIDITPKEWASLLSVAGELDLKSSDPFYKRHVDLISSGTDLPLDIQLWQFINGTTLSEECMEIRKEVLNDLRRVIQTRFAKSEIYTFGSYIMQLADRDSDLDIHVDTHHYSEPLPPARTDQEKTSWTSTYFRSNTVTGNGPNCKFNYMVTISKARIPLVRIKHRSSGIRIDLSFSNMISVQNSKLVDFYIRLDGRVKPLMLIVKYWARFHGFSGSYLIKNYALALMVIVFLVKKGIVPSVHQLQEGVQPMIIDGWNCAFNDNIQAVSKYIRTDAAEPPAVTASQVLDLAMEFFEMYFRLDLNSIVISGLAGKIIPRRYFWSDDNQQRGTEIELPEPEFEYYKTLAIAPLEVYRVSICVQDPFVLNFNVTKGTPADIYNRFRIACAETYTLLSEITFQSKFQFMDLFFPLSHLQSGSPNGLGKKAKRHLRDKEETILQELLNEFEVTTNRDHEACGDNYNTTLTVVPSDEFKDQFREAFRCSGLGKGAVIRKGKLIWAKFMRELMAEFFIKACKLSVIIEEVVGLGSDDAHQADSPDVCDCKLQRSGNKRPCAASGCTSESSDSSSGQSSSSPPSKVCKSGAHDGEDVKTSDQQDQMDPAITAKLKQKLDEISDDWIDEGDLALVCTGLSRIWEFRSKLRNQVKVEHLRNSSGLLDPLLVEERLTDLYFNKDPRWNKAGVEDPLFKLECLVKFNTKTKRGISIDIDFKELPTNDQEQDSIREACTNSLNNIRYTLLNTIPKYTLFRLQSWLQEDQAKLLLETERQQG